MGQVRNRRKTKKTREAILAYATLIALGVIFMYPLVFLAANSLRHYMDRIPIMFFTEFHFENYYFAVAMIPFFRYLLNTLKLVAIGVFGSVVMDFLVGYAFAKLNAPGKNFLFKLVLFQIMVPYIAIQIPQFVWYNTIGIMDTFWVFFLSALGGSAYNIFLVKQFLSSFPREIEEAAKIDGAGFATQITKIVIPLSKPLYVLLFFNAFVAAWNDYMGPSMFLTEKNFTLAAAMFGKLYFLPNKPEITLEPVQMAACVLFTVPVIILFFFCQKFLVQGIVTTGLKG